MHNWSFYILKSMDQKVIYNSLNAGNVFFAFCCFFLANHFDRLLLVFRLFLPYSVSSHYDLLSRGESDSQLFSWSKMLHCNFLLSCKHQPLLSTFPFFTFCSYSRCQNQLPTSSEPAVSPMTPTQAPDWSIRRSSFWSFMAVGRHLLHNAASVG